MLYGSKRLVHALHTYAIVPDLAGTNHVIEDAVDLFTAEDRGRRAMQLQQIDRIGREVLQAPIDPRGEVVAGVAGGRLRRQPPSRLRRHVDPLAWPLLAEPRDEALASPVTVDVRGVDEVDAGVDRRMQRADRFLVVDRTPRSTDRPRPEA